MGNDGGADSRRYERMKGKIYTQDYRHSLELGLLQVEILVVYGFRDVNG